MNIKQLDKYYMKKYGITWNDREKMLKKQKGCCALCGKAETEFKRRLHVDHLHSAKKEGIRGLLCYFCNFHRVGKLNTMWALKVYKYLKKYERGMLSK